MSAKEIIAELKKLTVLEQEQVLVYLQHAQGERRHNPDAVKYTSDENFDAAAEKVLRERAELFRRLAQ